MFSASEPENVLDPAHFASVRRPRDRAETMPPWVYTSERFYEAERQRIFFRNWNCIGHHSKVPKVGDYYTFEFVGVPLIVVRGDDMQVRAFINSCPHRGAELMAGAGQGKFMKCRYHAWTFDLQGNLFATPLVEETDCFKKADHGLRQVKLELFDGFMWINFDPDSISLKENLGDLPERTRVWGADSMVCVNSCEIEFDANWKFFTENFSDGLHVPFVHQTSIAKKKVAKRDFHDSAVFKGNYLMHYTYFDGSRGVPEGHAKLPELDLPPELKLGTFFPVVHTNALMGYAIDSVFMHEIHPLGPNRTRLVSTFMVPAASTEMPGFAQVIAKYKETSLTVLREDCEAAQWQHKGALSPICRRGCYAPQDRLLHDYDLWILDQMLGPV
ncbi:MAG TPA: aromatic ring-hydroxylating dioxygenase subunit alpha [Bordetella sp.]|jgi:phenylpropionate dioxygenase-like ring-hydroxylating dioxygenase large terminal subunit|nr:aromatic ring-hydroxylating dioxygenase subunit alpha [Bordetella sp.]